MAVNLNMVSIAGGGVGSSPKAVTASNSGSSRPRGSTKPSVTEPNYTRPVTPSRSPAGANLGSSGSGSGSRPNVPSKVTPNNNGNSISFKSFIDSSSKFFDKISWAWNKSNSIQTAATNYEMAAVVSLLGKDDLAKSYTDMGDYYYNYNPKVNGGNPVSSLINSGVAFGEGLVKAFENFSDAYYTAESMKTAGTHYDLSLVASALGYDDLAKSYNEFGDYFGDQKRIAEHISIDYTDKAFDALYSTQVMDAINDSAGNAWKRDTGFGYSVMKDVGEYAPAIVGSSIGGPALQALTVATNTYGEKLEENYQNVINAAEANGHQWGVSDLGVANIKAGISAIVDGGIVYAAGTIKANLTNGIQSGLDALDKFAGDALDPANKAFASHIGTDASIIVKSVKPFVNEAIDTFIYREDSDGDGQVDKFDWKECVSEALAIVGTEKVSSLIGDGLGKFKSSNKPSTPSLPAGSTVKPELSTIQADVPKISADGGKLSLQVLTHIADSKIETDIIKRIGKQATGDGIDVIEDMIEVKEWINNG